MGSREDGEQSSEPRIKLIWPGRRILKTGIAISLSLIYGRLVHPDLTAYFAVASAIVCMTRNIRNTFRTGMNRVIGTLIGGAAAVIWLAVLADLPVFENVWILGAVIVFTNMALIWLLAVLKLTDSAALTALTFTAILMFADKGSNGVASATLRASDAAVGALIALAVNWLPFLQPTEEEHARPVRNLRVAAAEMEARSKKRKNDQQSPSARL